MQQPTVIIIVGPTASGKTDAAIQLAQHFNANIISADARQCYIELNIGVAKPTIQQLATVPHHFINTHHITETLSVNVFEQYAIQKVQECFKTNQYIVVAGGTGLYVKAFCEGIDYLPNIPDEIRQSLRLQYAEKGIAWLQNQLHVYDPLFAQTDDLQNPQRMLRALEVVVHTGKSIRTFQTGAKQHRPFRIIKMGLEWEREILYNRINKRVEVMMQQGLEEEVKALIPYKHLPALQTVGYQELFAYFEGRCSLNEAVANIQQNTRHYAKRQLTWFKKDPSIQWMKEVEVSVVEKLIS